MTHHDDHSSAMDRHSAQLHDSFPGEDLDALLDCGGTPPGAEFEEVAAYLTSLQTLLELSPPRPSSELAAVLTHGLVPPAAPAPSALRSTRPSGRSRLLRRRLLALGLSAGIAVSLSGVAAASDRLPGGAQNVWDRLVESVNPSAVHDPRRPGPAVTETDNSGQRPFGPSADTDRGAGVGATGASAQDEDARQPTATEDAMPSADVDETVGDSRETAEGSPGDGSGTGEPEEADPEGSGSTGEAGNPDTEEEGVRTDDTAPADGDGEPAQEGDSEPETSVLPYQQVEPTPEEPDSTDLTETDEP